MPFPTWLFPQLQAAQSLLSPHPALMGTAGMVSGGAGPGAYGVPVTGGPAQAANAGFKPAGVLGHAASAAPVVAPASSTMSKAATAAPKERSGFDKWLIGEDALANMTDAQVKRARTTGILDMIGGGSNPIGNLNRARQSARASALGQKTLSARQRYLDYLKNQRAQTTDPAEVERLETMIGSEGSRYIAPWQSRRAQGMWGPSQGDPGNEVYYERDRAGTWRPVSEIGKRSRYKPTTLSEEAKRRGRRSQTNWEWLMKLEPESRWSALRRGDKRAIDAIDIWPWETQEQHTARLEAGGINAMRLPDEQDAIQTAWEQQRGLGPAPTGPGYLDRLRNRLPWAGATGTPTPSKPGGSSAPPAPGFDYDQTYRDLWDEYGY